MLDGRDFDVRPYTPDEARVAAYIVDLAGIGGGDDPIGFLIASHRTLSDANRRRVPVQEVDLETRESTLR